MKKQIFLIVAIFLFIQTAQSEASLPHVTSNEHEKNIEITDSSNKPISHENFKIGTFVGIFTIICHAVTLIAHEGSHALARVILGGSSSVDEIHLFCPPSGATNKPLFSLGKMHFHFNDLGGYCSGKFFEKKLHRNIILVAGGIGGALAGYSFLASIAAYCLYKSGNSLRKSIFLGLKQAFSPFTTITQSSLSMQQKKFLLGATSITLFYIIQNLFYGCTPNKYFTQPFGLDDNGDGERVWQSLLGKSSQFLFPLRIGFLVGEIVCFGLVLKNWLLALKEMRLNQKVTN